MKEIKDIISAYRKIDLNKNKVALATVIYVAGSSYRRAGARMLVQDNGIFTGGISGGCLEGDARIKASNCIVQNKIEVVRYDTTKDDEGDIGVGLGCNGIIDVLLTPIDPEAENNPVKILQSCIDDRKVNGLITIIQSDDPKLRPGQMIRYSKEENDLPGYLVKDVEAAIKNRKSEVKHYEGLSVFIEVLLPAINVVLFGCGYDVNPVLKIGNELGWDMDVVINPAKANRAMYKPARKIYNLDDKIPYDEFTAFVMMAHNYRTDMNNLKMALDSAVPYVGMLGPVKRRNAALEELKSNGYEFTEEQMKRLFNPIGLDIGATSPEEIALAILAEIRAYFSGNKGGFLREKPGTIHPRD